MQLRIFTDGGSRGNPGQGAIGVVIQSFSETKWLVSREFGKRIGHCTNNEAEYQAVIEALSEVIRLHIKPINIEFYLDSALVVNQLNGTFKIKQPHLRELLLKIRALEQEAGGSISYTNIPREQNKHADFLVNQALDES